MKNKIDERIEELEREIEDLEENIKKINDSHKISQCSFCGEFKKYTNEEYYDVSLETGKAELSALKFAKEVYENRTLVARDDGLITPYAKKLEKELSEKEAEFKKKIDEILSDVMDKPARYYLEKLKTLIGDEE